MTSKPHTQSPRAPIPLEEEPTILLRRGVLGAHMIEAARRLAAADRGRRARPDNPLARIGPPTPDNAA